MTTLEIVRARHIPPDLLVECAGNCTNHFKIGQGHAFPVMLPGADRPQMGFFCSPVCFLVLLDPANCAERG